MDSNNSNSARLLSNSSNARWDSNNSVRQHSNSVKPRNSNSARRRRNSIKPLRSSTKLRSILSSNALQIGCPILATLCGKAGIPQSSSGPFMNTFEVERCGQIATGT